MSAINYYFYDPIIIDIPDYPNYQISENGEVYNKTTGKEIKQYVDGCGYFAFKAYKNGVGKKLVIHRLLATLFINNPKNYELVDHINRNRQDNKLKNLRWCNRSQNGTNRGKNLNNKSGHTGIYYHKQSNNWKAKLVKDGKTYTKYFEYTDEGLQEAVKWRQEMEAKLHTYD